MVVGTYPDQEMRRAISYHAGSRAWAAMVTQPLGCCTPEKLTNAAVSAKPRSSKENVSAFEDARSSPSLSPKSLRSDHASTTSLEAQKSER